MLEPAAIFAFGLTVLAAASDMRSRRIPNLITITGLFAAFGVAMVADGAEGLKLSLAGACVGFMLMLPGFLLRYTGAGDVKLLAMLGAFSGPSVIFLIFAIAAISAALFVLVRRLMQLHGTDMVSHMRRYAAMLRGWFMTGHFVYQPPASDSALSQRVPMAPFVAFGLLVSLSSRLLGYSL